MTNKVLVIGDGCIDVFIYGTCKRLSPEGPVPVFIPKNTTQNMGMAGNVLRNLESLGLQVDFITNDELITKTRYIETSRNHLLLRIDDEQELKPVENLPIIEDYKAVVISDYDKGFLSKKIISKILSSAKISFLDTKKILGDWCKDATFIKLNKKEYEAQSEEIKKNNNLIVTLGADGCMYKGKQYPIEYVEIRDVSGAGDTFLSGFVAEYLKSNDAEKAILFAQECAINVIKRRGVNTLE